MSFISVNRRMELGSLAPTFGTLKRSLRTFTVSSHYDDRVAIMVLWKGVRLYEGLQWPSSCSFFREPGGHWSCPSYSLLLAEFKEERGGARTRLTEDRACHSRVRRETPDLWEHWTLTLKSAPGSWKSFWAGQWWEQVSPAVRCKASEGTPQTCGDPELRLQLWNHCSQSVESWWRLKLGPFIHSFTNIYCLVTLFQELFYSIKEQSQ